MRLALFRVSKQCQFALLFLGIAAVAGCFREKDRLDAQVRELCAKDGGMKVYEHLSRSVVQLNESGHIRVPFKEDVRPIDDYFYDWNTTYYQKGNPSMRRSNVKLTRRIDSKVLGEVVSYHRVGGDFPGPWRDSFFSCPEGANEVELAKLIFVNKLEK